MTEPGSLAYYPQYCFGLSPTLNIFCPLQASDIKTFTSQPGFEGQDVFFHKNHPVKWVRIAGIVVAIDEYSTRRIYTVDDSSGANIECTVNIPPQGKGSGQGLAPGTSHQTNKRALMSSGTGGKPQVYSDVDVGTVVDVKGCLKLFREEKQIKVEKMVVLRATDDEMRIWTKIEEFRTDVMDKPWRLNDRDVRRLRKEAEGADATSRRKKRRTGSTSAYGDRNAVSAKNRSEGETSRRKRITGLEKRPRATRARTQTGTQTGRESDTTS